MTPVASLGRSGLSDFVLQRVTALAAVVEVADDPPLGGEFDVQVEQRLHHRQPFALGQVQEALPGRGGIVAPFALRVQVFARPPTRRPAPAPTRSGRSV